MKKVVFEFQFEMDQDPVPGAFFEIEDTQRRLQAMMMHAFAWYNPRVTIVKTKLVDK